MLGLSAFTEAALRAVTPRATLDPVPGGNGDSSEVVNVPKPRACYELIGYGP